MFAPACLRCVRMGKPPPAGEGLDHLTHSGWGRSTEKCAATTGFRSSTSSSRRRRLDERCERQTCAYSINFHCEMVTENKSHLSISIDIFLFCTAASKLR